MDKKILSFFGLTFVLALSPYVIPVFAEEDEKLAFASYLEETLGHFWALEQNLDDNNAELALVHATHPVAELYDLIKPELQEHDPELDARVQQILLNLGERTSSDVTREEAQEAIDEAKEVIEIARATVVGEELSNDVNFKINLINGLLETSVAEYGEAVSEGQINEMAEFQDGSAFVWKSQQIYDTIKTEVPEHEAEEIDEFYEDLWAAYDAKADPSDVETITNGITHELEEVSGEKNEESEELTDYVENIRNLLTAAKEEYAEGETDKALSLATKAYLDNFEFLEAAVGAQNPELNEEIEYMMREELRDMIKNGASIEDVNAHIDAILLKMDEVAVIVPEFGPMAFMVLTLAIISIIVLGIRKQRIIPKF